MNEGITIKLIQLSSRLEELNSLLSSEDVTSDLNNYRKLTREHAEIVPVVELYRAYQLGECDIQAAQEMIADTEMREFAEEEIRSGKEKLTQIELELQKLLLPKDPNDEHNIFCWNSRGVLLFHDKTTAEKSQEERHGPRRRSRCRQKKIRN